MIKVQEYTFGDLYRLKKRFDNDDILDDWEFDDAEQWAFRVVSTL